MSSLKSKLKYIVCVGTSAGGLEALIDLLKLIPKKNTMAFVLVQHLEPQHKSALSEILSRETSLNIREAKNNTKVEPSHVYVIPPNSLIALSEGRLKITARIKRADGRYLPVDFFMTSLAKEQNKKAIGIILSGTGSDGTLGAKAIKDKGGIVFAQNKKTARYFGMPESVIKSGAADFILTPREIAQKLIYLETHEYRKPLKPAAQNLGEKNYLNQILILLRDLTGVDFIHYKQTTIGRRIARRMAFHNIDNYSDYFHYLTKNPTEADLLLKNILIPVTSFFRDPEVFKTLRKKMFPLIPKPYSLVGGRMLIWRRSLFFCHLSL